MGNKPKSQTINRLSLTDITEARMKNLAREACLNCAGEIEHDKHRPIRSQHVVRIVEFDKKRPDMAWGLFQMTRGATIVNIDGLEERRWFWPTLDAAKTIYSDLVNKAQNRVQDDTGEGEI